VKVETPGVVVVANAVDASVEAGGLDAGSQVGNPEQT
jgi:hypothetical protein